MYYKQLMGRSAKLSWLGCKFWARNVWGRNVLGRGIVLEKYLTDRPIGKSNHM